MPELLNPDEVLIVRRPKRKVASRRRIKGNQRIGVDWESEGEDEGGLTDLEEKDQGVQMIEEEGCGPI